MGQGKAWGGLLPPAQPQLLASSFRVQSSAEDGKAKQQLQQHQTGWLMDSSSIVSFSTVYNMMNNIFSFSHAFSTHIRCEVGFTGPLLTKQSLRWQYLSYYSLCQSVIHPGYCHVFYFKFLQREIPHIFTYSRQATIRKCKWCWNVRESIV